MVTILNPVAMLVTTTATLLFRMEVGAFVITLIRRKINITKQMIVNAAPELAGLPRALTTQLERLESFYQDATASLRDCKLGPPGDSKAHRCRALARYMHKVVKE